MSRPGAELPPGGDQFERWAELRSAAMALAGHGWPVLRGTYPAADGGGVNRWQGRPDAVGLRPIADDWAEACTVRASDVAQWWSQAPYGVIVACGRGVDCIEIPGRVAQGLLHELSEAGVCPPAMLTPVGSLVLFVGTHPGPRPMLAAASLRSLDSWVAVPPTATATAAPGAARYRWLPNSAPGALGWQLPELLAVNEVITAALRQPPHRRPSGDPSTKPGR